MTLNLRRHAKKILQAHRADGALAFPGYVPFDIEARPTWWTEGGEDEAWGEIIGVHENQPGSPIGAIIIATNGIAFVACEGAIAWVPYAEIGGWEQLSKEPPSTSLKVNLTTGGRVELPFDRGGAFGFVQFLINAKREHRKHSSTRTE